MIKYVVYVQLHDMISVGVCTTPMRVVKYYVNLYKLHKNLILSLAVHCENVYYAWSNMFIVLL